MWKTFWGDDFSHIQPSNRKNVVAGAWRVEVSPRISAEQDLFLHVFEMGDLGATGKNRIELIEGVNFTGAASQGGPCVLFSTSEPGVRSGEASLPDLACSSVIVSGLLPDSLYELSFTGPNVSSSADAVLPGVLAERLHLRTNTHGVLRLEKPRLGNLRLRIAAV
jgi:hypothetical protein